MKIVICDDDVMHINKIKKILEDYFKGLKIKYEIFSFTSGEDLFKDYESGKYDFIFLDVDMPATNGFETASEIRAVDLDVDIIFVTYMINSIQMGYNYNAKQYISKPISEQVIVTLIDRLIHERRRKKEMSFYEIRLKHDEGTVFLRLQEVIYFENVGNYMFAATKDENFTFRGVISQVENDLKNKGFIRIHRSYLVNKEYIFKNFVGKLLLKSGDELPCSRFYAKSVNEAVKKVW